MNFYCLLNKGIRYLIYIYKKNIYIYIYKNVNKSF